MRNLNLDQLQTLIAIADLGTFAAAAQALHLAAPTVSLHIKELESRMDAQLLVRGRKQTTLTAAGQVLMEHGRKLLQASDDVVERVQRRASGREGLVRVGVAVLEELWVALAHQGVKFWGHGAGFFWCDGRHHLWRCDELCRWQVLIDFGLQPLYGRR